MRRKIIIGIILILIFSISYGIIYLNNVYLPVKVKGQLAEALSKYLNYNVEIEGLKYSPIRGVIIQNIAVYDKVKDKDNTILTVKEASFHILILPLIQERKIIIPVMYIDSPSLNIRYRQDNTFNFSRIFLPKPPPKTKPKTKSSLLAYRINILRGKAVFTDERFTPKFTKTIEDLNIVLGVRQLTKIGFLIKCDILTAKEGISALSVKGIYNLLSKEVNSKLRLVNFMLPEYSPYMSALPVSISAGTVDNAQLDVNLKNHLINLKGAISAKGLGLNREKMTLTGDADIITELNYAIDRKIFDYKANIKLTQAKLDGIKYAEKLNNISGDLGFVKNKIWTENLKFETLGSAFTLKGILDDSTTPYISLNFKSEQVILERIRFLLPFKLEGTNLTGTAAAEINVEGFLGRPPLNTKAALRVSDAKLETALLKAPVNNIKGKINFTQDNANWADLTFNYLNTAYTTTGRINDFHAPNIDYSLASKDLDLKNIIKIKDKLIKIVSFQGKYLHSKFNVEGAVDNQDKNNPVMNLVLNEINLYPADTYAFLPPGLAENLKKCKLDGALDIKGTLNGKAKDYKSWNASLKGASGAFSVYNLKFTDLLFNLNQNSGIMNIDRLSASCYAGLINMAFGSDLNPVAPTYYLKFNGSGINLEKLKSDTGLKDKDIAGILNINAELSGNFNDPASLKGNGLISVKDGKLWQLNFFKGLGEFFLLPDYEKVMFKEAMGDFSVQDKAVSTENLRLTSEQLNLNCSGKLGFDGTLDFTLYSEVNKNLINESSDVRKFTTAILGNFSDALTIKVSGTIQKPKYKIVPVATDIIKNIKDFILGK